MVEQDLAVRHAYLRALVADDRPIQSKSLRPRKRARKGAPGGGDDGDAGLFDPLQRLFVFRVDTQVPVEDRPVEVEGKKPDPGRSGQRLTSGLSTFGGLPPRTAVAMVRAAMGDISERVL